MQTSFTKGEILYSILMQLRGGKQLLPMPANFQLSLAQKNLYTKEEYFGMAYSCILQLVFFVI